MTGNSSCSLYQGCGTSRCVLSLAFVCEAKDSRFPAFLNFCCCLVTSAWTAKASIHLLCITLRPVWFQQWQIALQPGKLTRLFSKVISAREIIPTLLPGRQKLTCLLCHRGNISLRKLTLLHWCCSVLCSNFLHVLCTAVYANCGSPCKFMCFFLFPAQGSEVTVKYSVSLTGQLLLVNTHVLPAETCRPLGMLSADACGLGGFCGNSSFGCGDSGNLFMDLDRMANVASLSTAVTVSH